MRFLLAGVTVVAIGAALLTSMPYALEFLGTALALTLFSGMAPVCVATLAVYCQGFRRTFFAGAAIGTLIPLALAWEEVTRLDHVATWLGLVTSEIVATLSCGATAVATRRFLERRGWHLPEKNPAPRDPERRP